MPFAAIGFASVVSMIPGVFLFRVSSGLIQLAHGGGTSDLLGATATDGVTAVTIILAMSFGLVVSRMFTDHFAERGRS